MENNRINLATRNDILNNIVEILKDENRFESVEKSMPDMITCKFFGSSIFPKSRKFKGTSMLQCSFVAYEDGITFNIDYFPPKDCKNYVKRLNNELLYLKTPIDEESKDMSIPVTFTIMNEFDMQNIINAKSEEIKMNLLKFQIDYFFKKYANKIIHKIIEIMLNVVV